MSRFLTTPGDWPSILLGRAAAVSADPSDLDAAVRAGAFEGLRRAVRDHGAVGTIATIAGSGLRGRGGAGFPTGEKWRAAAAQPADQRYVIANGYGADPAVHTDAALLAADPYGVIEGLAIAAFAIGATEAILAVRADDPALVTMLEGAVLAAEEAGFLGEDAAGSGHRVTRDGPPGPGRLHAGRGDGPHQGPRGQARPARPAPAVPHREGAVRQADRRQQRPDPGRGPVDHAQRPRGVRRDIGATASPGTVLVQLRGPEGGGIAEVPLGTPLRELVRLAGGTGSRALKAILVGGPTGGLLPPDLLDTPYEFDALRDGRRPHRLRVAWSSPTIVPASWTSRGS